MVSIKQLFEWFATGKFPNEDQFQEQFKSFWHKSERLPILQVLGLNDALNDKASKDDLENATTKFKGYYSTLAELQTAYPQSENKKDFFAWVGSPYPGTVWKVKVDGGAFVDTGEVPTQQEIDLAEYVAKKDIKNELGDSATSPIAQQIATQEFEKKADKTEIVTEQIDKKKVYIADEDDKVVASWSESGIFDTPKLSNNLIEVIKDDAEILTESINKDAVYIADEKGKVVAKWDKRGVFDTPKISDRLIEYIASKLGGIITPSEPTFLADVYLIPCYGQSLSVNTSAGASTFSSVVPISYDVNLNNTNIQDMCAGTAEAFMIMSDFSGVDLPENFKIMHCLGGAGGRSIKQLSKGTSYYNNVINSVRTAKNKCDAAGLTFNVPCFTWTQGEEDMSCGRDATKYGYGDFDPYIYKDRLRQLIDDFNTDIKAITGQENDVLCISYQVGSDNAYCRYPRIALQQAELAMEDDRMILAKTMYDIDYVTESSAGFGTYQVHAPAKSYRNMGNMYGLAAWNRTVMNKQHKCLRPIYHSVNGKEIVVKFDVPSPPLVLDALLVNQLPDGNYGFNIYAVDEQRGAAGSIVKSEVKIVAVNVVSSDTLKITLDKEPKTGERLTYGVNGDYWQNIDGSFTVNSNGEGADGIKKSGRIAGSRGCLRDSNPIENNNSGAGYVNLYNWCVIFEIKL